MSSGTPQATNERNCRGETASEARLTVSVRFTAPDTPTPPQAREGELDPLLVAFVRALARASARDDHLASQPIRRGRPQKRVLVPRG
jgi:hypothetical protein